MHLIPASYPEEGQYEQGNLCLLEDKNKNCKKDNK